jgi:hypothetical protein
MNVFGQDGTGTGYKRTLTTAVSAVTAQDIQTGMEGASTCHGDSGGPVFDGAGALVATTSWGDPDCHGSAHDMRVDDNLDFLNAFLSSGGGGGGNKCSVNQNGLGIDCTDGACTCSVNGQVIGTCTAPDPSVACSSPGNCCGF